MWKRRKLRRRTAIPFTKVFILIFILLIFLTFFFVKNGILQIKEIRVEGNISCADEIVLKDYSKLLGQNFFLIDNLKIEDKLKKKFLCISSADIKKIFPNKINIQVINRNPLAALVSLKLQEASNTAWIENVATPSAEQAENYYLADNEIIFSKGVDSLNIPEIFLTNSEVTLGQKLTTAIADSINILEKVKRLGIEINKSVISGDVLIINPDTLDQKIIFRLNDKIDVQLASLQLILNKAKMDLTKLAFIDLRFDKPVVKFAPKK